MEQENNSKMSQKKQVLTEAKASKTKKDTLAPRDLDLFIKLHIANHRPG